MNSIFALFPCILPYETLAVLVLVKLKGLPRTQPCQCMLPKAYYKRRGAYLALVKKKNILENKSVIPFSDVISKKYLSLLWEEKRDVLAYFASLLLSELSVCQYKCEF